MSIREPGANHSQSPLERFQPPLPVDDEELAVERERLWAEMRRLADELRSLNEALLRGEGPESLWDERQQKRAAQEQLEAQSVQLNQWMQLAPEDRRRVVAERKRLEEEQEQQTVERERAAVKYEQIVSKWAQIAGEWEHSLEVEEGGDSYSDPDSVAIDLGESITVLICAWVVAPYVQGLAGQAATGTYRAFTNKLRGVLGTRRRPDGERWDLVVLRTPDGKLKVQIPGDLPEEVHAALVRDFVEIVDKATEDERIHVIWDERSRTWINGTP